MVKDASAVPLVDETADSCITHQSLDRAADTYCAPDTAVPIIEVKQELLQYVKTEDACGESDMEYQQVSVKVSVYAVRIFMFLKHAAYLLGYLKRVMLHKIFFDQQLITVLAW